MNNKNVKLLYEVGMGIGNNVHATGVIYGMLAHPRFKDFIITVRTKFPQIWTPVDGLIITDHKDIPSTEMYDYHAHTLFRLENDFSINVKTEIPLSYDKSLFTQFHEVEINSSAIEQFFNVNLHAKKYRRVNCNKSDTFQRGLIGLINGGTRSTQWLNKRWNGWDKLASHHFNSNSMQLLTRCFYNDIADKIEGCDDEINTDLLKAAFHLTECELIIGNDCGLLHVADALGVPTIAIFGPTYHEKNKPIGKFSKTIRRGLPCQPCQGTPLQANCKNPDCMTGIGPSTVFGYTIKHLNDIRKERN